MVRVLQLVLVPIFTAAIAYFELARPTSSFRAGSLVFAFLLAADLTTLARGRLRDALLAATALIFGFAVLECMSDFQHPAVYARTTKGETAHVPVMGWGPGHPGRFAAKETDPKTGRVIYDVAYTIDDNLLRKTESCAHCPTVAFFGDSFTFGEGLNDAETLPQLFADAMGGRLRVLNLGFSGYGPQQFLREEETGRFDTVIGPSPKLFVMLTAPWHVERTACKADWVTYGPRYALDNGHAVYKGPCFTGPLLWLQDWMVHTGPYRLFVEPALFRINRHDVDLYVQILIDATHLAREKYGAATLIPYIRAPAILKPLGLTDDEIIARLQAGGAKVLDVSLPDSPENIIVGDGHPNAHANRIRAAMLKAFVAEDFPNLLAKSAPALAPQQVSAH